MDNPDRDFEAFLRQFHLRRPKPFLEEMPPVVPVRRKRHSWVLAAAAVIVAALLSVSLLRNFLRPTGPSATVEAPGDSSYRVGEKIAAGSAGNKRRSIRCVHDLGSTG